MTTQRRRGLAGRRGWRLGAADDRDRGRGGGRGRPREAEGAAPGRSTELAELGSSRGEGWQRRDGEDAGKGRHGGGGGPAVDGDAEAGLVKLGDARREAARRRVAGAW